LRHALRRALDNPVDAESRDGSGTSGSSGSNKRHRSDDSASSGAGGDLVLLNAIDWHDCSHYEYGDIPDSLLAEAKCPISHGVVVCAVELKCCKKLICDRCAPRVRKCPFCRASGGRYDWSRASRALQNLVDSLLVKCPACETLLQRERLAAHYEAVCPKALVRCTRLGCGAEGPRADMQRHAEDCKLVVVTCPLGCDVSSLTRGAAAEHVAQHCPRRLVPCPNGPNCSDGRVQFAELIPHLANECSLRHVTCAGQSLGCSWTGTAASEHEHESGCTFARLQPVLLGLQMRVTALEARNAEQAQRIDQMQLDALWTPARLRDGETLDVCWDDAGWRRARVIARSEHMLRVADETGNERWIALPKDRMLPPGSATPRC
jgi:hypothetical protein